MIESNIIWSEKFFISKEYSVDCKAQAEIEGMLFLFDFCTHIRASREQTVHYQNSRMVSWWEWSMLRHKDLMIDSERDRTTGLIVGVCIGSMSNVYIRGTESRYPDAERRKDISLASIIINLGKINIFRTQYDETISCLQERKLLQHMDANQLIGGFDQATIYELKSMSEQILNMEMRRIEKEEHQRQEEAAKRQKEEAERQRQEDERERHRQELYGVIPAAKNALAIVQGKKPKKREKIKWGEMAKRIGATVVDEAKDVAARTISHIVGGGK